MVNCKKERTVGRKMIYHVDVDCPICHREVNLESIKRYDTKVIREFLESAQQDFEEDWYAIATIQSLFHKLEKGK